MKSMLKDVKIFMEKMRLPVYRRPRRLMPKIDFRLLHLKEELEELTSAYNKEDLPMVADALVDLVYVSLGTALMLGLPWQELWDEVHRKNLLKEPGITSRSTKFDVVKPTGWQPPDLNGIIESHGFED